MGAEHGLQGRGRPVLPDVVDDEIGWGYEEVIHSCKRRSNEVLALASAGFRDHL